MFPIDSIRSGTTTDTRTGVAQGANLNKQDFLKLFIAQVQHQNPMEPQNGAEFMGHLAQLATVDGINNMQSDLERLCNHFEKNNLDSTSLIGKSVLVAGNIVDLKSDDSSFSGVVDVNLPTKNLSIDIYNMSNELVKRVDMGPQFGKEVAFDIEAMGNKSEALCSGRYRLVASAAEDNIPSFPVSVFDKVIGVNMQEKVKVVTETTGEVGIGRIKQIRE